MVKDCPPLLICDVTQSYSPKGGGGVSTYLREKANYVRDHTPHRLLQIVPGPEDKIVEDGRHIFVTVGSAPVRGSPNYHFITRRSQVRRVLEQFRPDLIESQCPWFMPWTAIYYRRSHPRTTLVAGYHTDFPNAQVHRVTRDLWGPQAAWFWRKMSLGYLEITYREFDWVYAMNEGSRTLLNQCACPRVDVIDLGFETGCFHPDRRDPDYRAKLGLSGNGPLLVYAGRLDNEKRADRLVEMMRQLPRDLGAALVMIGDGKLAGQFKAQCAAENLPVAFPGFLTDRLALATALASCDIYVSAMADETFGISVIEAQASGLPVVGVHAGAMPERVTPEYGLLGPVDDAAAMARNVCTLWAANPRAMGAAAAQMVRDRYDWTHTFQRLFREIYPKARRHARERVLNRHKLAMPRPIAALEAQVAARLASTPR